MEHYLFQQYQVYDLNYLIGKKPIHFLCSDKVSIDIGTEIDFEIAKIIFKMANEKKVYFKMKKLKKKL